MSTLRVDVLAFDMPCQQCAMPLRWVFGLLPSHRPDGDEFTTTDFPEAVDVARSIHRPRRRLHGPGRTTARPARPAAGTQLQPEHAAAAGTRPTGTFSAMSSTAPSTRAGSAWQRAEFRCRSGARSVAGDRNLLAVPVTLPAPGPASQAVIVASPDGMLRT